MAQNRTILVIHQSADLYGSDKSLFSLLGALANSEYQLIVCLPVYGPLVEDLKKVNIEVQILPLLKVGRHTLTNLWRFWKLPSILANSLNGIDKVVGNRKIDLVYTNTIAVLAGAYWAKRRRVAHIWHVREIISKPIFVSQAFVFLTKYFSTKLICNSDNTRQWIDPSAQKRSVTVWNGVETILDGSIDTAKQYAARNRFEVTDGEVVVLMAGRINSWKGQDLLLEALEHIPLEIRKFIRVLIVGSSPSGQPHHTEKLKRLINNSTIKDKIIFHEFNRDLDDYYLAADILIVPSKLPEPFGRVAIEAMAFSLPVIAAKHGGLLEIIEDEQTGLLFEPNNCVALSKAILSLIHDPAKRKHLGKAGQLRQSQLFSVDTYVQKIKDIFDETIKCS